MSTDPVDLYDVDPTLPQTPDRTTPIDVATASAN
jgi:hypothetical protein